MERRTFLRFSVVGASTAAFTGSLWGQAFAAPAQQGPSPYGPLLAADANGIRLPSSLTSRVIARSSQIVSGTGGASEIHFSSSGTITSASRILSNTNRNCAGGATPWNTWLSCEEVDTGYVWETYPFGGTAVRRDAMGRFNHEAAAADPARQVSGAKRFNGGEGCHYAGDTCWFTTKGDNRGWQLNLSNSTYELAYDDNLVSGGGAPLTGIDNITGSASGDLFVAEDGGNMEINIITPDDIVAPFLRITGQSSSEITGPAFSPDGSRLYLSSQRGTSGSSSGGITYEVRGPFR